jgi:hypothetical protein
MEKSTAMVFGLSGYTAAEGAAGAKPATGDASFRHEATPRVEWAGALAESGGSRKAKPHPAVDQSHTRCSISAGL